MCISIALSIVKFQRRVTNNAILSALTVQLSFYVPLKIENFAFPSKQLKACAYEHPFN